MKSNLISLSDRFALWIGFYDNNKENYLQTVKYYLKLSDKTLSKDCVKKAMEWSINKGSFSGRCALQFVNNFINKNL